MQVQTEEKFKECCQILKKGDVLKADELLKEVLMEALDNEQIKFAVNCFCAPVCRPVNRKSFRSGWFTFPNLVQCLLKMTGMRPM